MKQNLKLLPWDTAFFNLKIGSVQIDADNEIDICSILEEANRDGYDLLYIFNDINSQLPEINCPNYTVKLVDNKVIFSKLIENCDNEPEVESLKSINNYDLDRLYFLALESGHYSRYKLDGKLAIHFERFYKTWIDNSINNTIADEIFVYRTSSEIAGFVSIKYGQDESVIGLIAVDPTFRGKKIGEKLMKKCFFESVRNKNKTITVATQLENIGACKFYHRMGMNIKNTNKIYHAWIKR